MWGGTQDFNRRRGGVSFARALQPHTHTLARDRQWNRHSPMPKPRESLAGRPDAIDLDDEIVCGLRGRCRLLRDLCGHDLRVRRG